MHEMMKLSMNLLIVIDYFLMFDVLLSLKCTFTSLPVSNNFGATGHVNMAD